MTDAKLRAVAQLAETANRFAAAYPEADANIASITDRMTQVLAGDGVDLTIDVLIGVMLGATMEAAITSNTATQTRIAPGDPNTALIVAIGRAASQLLEG